MLELAIKDQLEETTVLDLDQEAVDREIARERFGDHSGPPAENILRDIGPGRAAETG